MLSERRKVGVSCIHLEPRGVEILPRVLEVDVQVGHAAAHQLAHDVAVPHVVPRRPVPHLLHLKGRQGAGAAVVVQGL